MSTLSPVIARIILRYLSGAMIAVGTFSPDTAAQIGVDPDLVTLLAVAISAAVEGAYALAKRKGWMT